jgi:8-oxo-dGTP diphosphatase
MIIGSMETELVAGLIIRGRRLLLVRNAKYAKVRIEPPGGKVEAGETRERALTREVAEETGLVVLSQSYFGAYKTDSPEGVFIVHTYLCKVAEGEPEVREPEKTPEVGWYTAEELEELSRGPELAPNMVAAMGEVIELLG